MASTINGGNQGFPTGLPNTLLPTTTTGITSSEPARTDSTAPSTSSGRSTQHMEDSFVQGQSSSRSEVRSLPTDQVLIAGLPTNAETAARNVRNTLDEGKHYPDRNSLFNYLQGSGVPRQERDALMQRNDQAVQSVIQTAESALDRGTFVSDLGQRLPALVRSGYVTEQRAQQLSDRNWVEWVEHALQTEPSRAPSISEINNRGYEMIQRGNVTPERVQQLKDLAQERTGQTTAQQGVGQTQEAPSREEIDNMGRILDGTSTALDLLGLIPGLGEAADLTNVALNLGRGRPVDAALSAISLLPVAGDAIGKGAKLAMRAADPALARRVLDMMSQVDVKSFIRGLTDNPQLRGLGDQLGRAVDDLIAQLENLAGGGRLQPALPDGGALPMGRPLEARTNPGSSGTPSSRPGTTSSSSTSQLSPTTPRTANGSAAPTLRDGFRASAQYTQASQLAVLVPNSSAWRQAVQALRAGGPEAINNVRVANASDARRLLNEAFPPGSANALEHSRTYTNGSARSYQLHPPDAQEVNDLSHIKWQTPEGEGHIFFGNPGNSGASTHYVTQRDFEVMQRDLGLTADELRDLGIQPGGNLIGPDGRGLHNNHYLQPQNRPGL